MLNRPPRVFWFHVLGVVLAVFLLTLPICTLTRRCGPAPVSSASAVPSADPPAPSAPASAPSASSSPGLPPVSPPRPEVVQDLRTVLGTWRFGDSTDLWVREGMAQRPPIPYPYQVVGIALDCGVFPDLHDDGWRTALCVDQTGRRTATRMYLRRRGETLEVETRSVTISGLLPVTP